MALPIWGMYMKDLYADKELKISKDNFERPDNLSIELDCENYGKNPDLDNTIPDELDF